MENASKALLIAAAILIAILLISLGIYSYTQGQSVVNNNGMGEAEIQSFNNKFLKYEGSHSGTEIKSLIQEVIATNAGIEDKSLQIEVTGGGLSNKKDAKDLSTISSKISTQSKYTVTFGYADKGTNNGKINSITIK